MKEWWRKRKIRRFRKKYGKTARTFIRLIESCPYNSGYQCAKDHDRRDDCPPECVFSPTKEMKVKF
jgi:hypothetical protein